MTTTAIIAAASVGGTPGEVNAVEHTADPASTAYVLALRVTLPAVDVPNFRNQLYLCHASTPFTGAGPASLRHSCRRQLIEFPKPESNKVFIFASDVEQLVGDRVHVWLETGVFDDPLVVDVSLTEF